MRTEEARVATASEMERILEQHGCRMDAWCEDEEILALRPYDEVIVSVWGPNGESLFEDIVLAEQVWETFDFVATLFNGGLLP